MRDQWSAEYQVAADVIRHGIIGLVHTRRLYSFLIIDQFVKNVVNLPYYSSI